jgi:hypothetical protein
VSPDGAWLMCDHDGKILIQSSASGKSKEFPKLLGQQRPIAWGSDAQHMFTQETEIYGVTISRPDLETGKVEPWQTIKPKEQAGLCAMTVPVAITPDGKWMAYAYGNELDQLYVSDGLE